MCNYYEAIKTAVQVAAYTLMKVQERKTQKEIESYENEQIIQAAKREEEKASEEIQEGVEEARNKRLQTILSMDKEKAAFAAGNLATSSLTLNEINEDEKAMNELSVLKTMNDAERRARNNLIQADKYYTNAALNTVKSEQAFRNSMMTIMTNTSVNAANKLLDSNKEKINNSIGNKVNVLANKFIKK